MVNGKQYEVFQILINYNYNTGIKKVSYIAILACQKACYPLMQNKKQRYICQDLNQIDGILYLNATWL